jgi:hypothetical protein
MAMNFGLADTQAPERMVTNALAAGRMGEQDQRNALTFQNQQEDRLTNNALRDEAAGLARQKHQASLLPLIGQAMYADPSDQMVDVLAGTWSKATGQDVSEMAANIKMMPPEKRRAVARQMMGKSVDPQFKVFENDGVVGAYSYDPESRRFTQEGTFTMPTANTPPKPNFGWTRDKDGVLQPEKNGPYDKDSPNFKKPTNSLGLNDEENEALFGVDGAVTTGRLDPKRVNSRTAKIFAQAEMTNKGVDYTGISGDISAIGKSIDQQEKQVGSMGSFVKNIEKQVDRVKDVAGKVSSFDTRLLNIPLRTLRGKFAGSPDQAKLDLYVEEISSETAKLATGSTGSVAELSVSAREKWEKIHDPNLSMADLLVLLEETKHAGKMRMESVEEQLKETRKKRDNIGNKDGKPKEGGASAGAQGSSVNSKGWALHKDEQGNKAYVGPNGEIEEVK